MTFSCRWKEIRWCNMWSRIVVGLGVVTEKGRDYKGSSQKASIKTCNESE